MARINIAKDFSVFPGGRYPSDGKYSGEEFRNEYLIPKLYSLKENELLTIELDGTRGYGSSFLEESFGGLVRNGFNKSYLHKKIELITNRSGLKEEIWDYIDSARVGE